MSFRRIVAPLEIASGDQLTSDLIGIGFRLQGKTRKNPNIEDTLLAASIEGMGGDLRLLSLLVDWIDIHYPRINCDRLFRIVKIHSNKRVTAFWSAIARWKSSDRRFCRLAKLHKGRKVDLLTSGGDFHIKRNGEDPRFAKSSLRVPLKAGLRNRPSDILEPKKLAKIHSAYRHRLIIGPSYRADMWAQMELDSSLSPADLARATYGSFATAWQVKNEWALVQVPA